MKTSAMSKIGFASLAAAATIVLAQAAAACELEMEESEVFGPTCNVLVGYYNGDRIGPFHTSFSDGSIATAGTCEGYVKVISVDGNTISLGAFHHAPARTITLNDNCVGSVK